jgi:hypothetical protein
VKRTPKRTHNLSDSFSGGAYYASLLPQHQHERHFFLYNTNTINSKCTLTFTRHKKKTMPGMKRCQYHCRDLLQLEQVEFKQAEFKRRRSDDSLDSNYSNYSQDSPEMDSICLRLERIVTGESEKKARTSPSEVE